MNKVYALLLIIIAFASCETNKSGYFTRDGLTQGTTYHIVFEIPHNAAKAGLTYEAICDSIELYLKDIDFALSGYNKASILSLFNSNPDSLNSILHSITATYAKDGTEERAKEFLRRYAIFIDNFNLAQSAYNKTDAFVDCSAAPLFDLWGFGFKQGTDVTQTQIDSVKQFIGMDNFTINYLSNDTTKNISNNSESNYKNDIAIISKKDNRCRLNFNAIAQGFTADYIASHFSKMGINNYLIEVGGEILAKGKNAKGGKWRVGIDRPEDGNNASGEKIEEIVEIADGGLVTSGDYRKFYIKEGKKISHTINPKSGYPVEHNLLSATIIAPSSALADIYATYCMVIGLEKAQEFVQKESLIMGAVLIYSVTDNCITSNSSSINDSMIIWKHKLY